MKIVKGDSILDVSDKAYGVIYKSHGYTEYLEDAKKQVVKKPAKGKAGEKPC